MVLTEERERRRIATELHDRIGQALTLSKLKLDTLLDAEDLSQHAAALNTISNLLEQTIQDARLLTFELSPPVLYELGLEAALEWLLEQIQEQHGLETEFTMTLQPKPLDYPFRVLIFQAVRELLFNIVKHARADRVYLSVKRDNGTMRIDIQDDGVGFDTARISFVRSIKTVGSDCSASVNACTILADDMAVTSEIGKGTQREPGFTAAANVKCLQQRDRDMRKKILLVDDHEILREGLRTLIETKTDMEVVAEADNGRSGDPTGP